MKIVKMRSSGLVLFACAGLLLSGGAILGGSTIWSLLRMSYYFWTTDLGAEMSCAVLLVASSVLCLPACWLATLAPYHPRSLSLMGTLMFVVTAASLLLSVGMCSLSGLSRAVRDTDAVNASMLRALVFEPLDPAVRSSFASMQLELNCCGVQSHNDWLVHRRTLPPSCCNRVFNKISEKCERPVHRGGCLRPALREMRLFLNSLAILSCAMVLVMAVTQFAAAYMLVTSLMEYEEARGSKLQAMRVAYLSPRAPPPLLSYTAPLAMSASMSAPLPGV